MKLTRTGHVLLVKITVTSHWSLVIRNIGQIQTNISEYSLEFKDSPWLLVTND